MKTKHGGFMIGIGAAVGIMLAAAGPAAADFVAASGGNYTNVYTTNGVQYRAHIFTNSGSLTFDVGGYVEYLVVGGGGGGGGGLNNGPMAGGGGGGGCRIGSMSVVASAEPVSVVVGQGGAGGLGESTIVRSTNGGFSQLGNIKADGGGAGGGNGYSALAGGCGGGGGNSAGLTNGAAGDTPPFDPSQVQGFSGGSGGVSPGGGGGGSAQAGITATNGTYDGSHSAEYGKMGGNGISSSISGTTTNYGGGGGGGQVYGQSTGGAGGGGSGSMSLGGGNPTAGKDNLGGGGGGAAAQGTRSGAKGGSGIVIVRYAIAATVPLVYTSDATDLTANSATLNGTLTYLPVGQTAEVRVYWGTNDAGPTAAGWMNTNVVATGVGTAPTNYSFSATSLSTNIYYYRYYAATNTAGSGANWGGVRSFQLLTMATDLGLAVYGYPARTTTFQWQDSELGTSWLDIGNETNWHLRVTKAMYTATPYYRVRMMQGPLPPVYSRTAKLTEKDAVSGTIFLLR